MLVRALCKNADTSGNPENVYVNTLFFDTLQQNLAGVADLLMPDIAAMYTYVSAFMSGVLNNELEVRFYDMADPQPRIPEIRTVTIAYGDPTKAALPEELAIVCTLLPDPPVTRRRRGRFYLGPLNTDAMTYAVGDVHPMVTSALVSGLGIAADQLRLACEAQSTPWVVFSKTYGNVTPISGGYVDDAFDIQRRRGVDASGRTYWGGAGTLRTAERARAVAASGEESVWDHLTPGGADQPAGV